MENSTLLQSDPVLAEMVMRLVKGFAPEKIYLFGSRARGESRSDSDYDLMMILSSSTLPRFKRDQASYRALCGVKAAKDIIVMTRSEFDGKRTVVCSLPATVEREGKLLYAV